MNPGNAGRAPVFRLSWLRPRSIAVVCVFVFVCGAAGSLSAQELRPTEYQVKATYLFNFAQFVQWPRDLPVSKDGPFSICVLGQDPFASTLDTTLSGEMVYGKSVIAMRVAGAQEASGCRILFISSSEEGRLEQILGSLGRSCVLTVSDIPYFAQRGGMIEFTSDGNRIRFAVNLKSAKDARLTMSSELLKLAVSVRRKPQPGD